MLTNKIDQPHSFSAVFKGAFTLILFAFSIASNAQTFSSTSPYRADEQAMIVSEQHQRYTSYQSTVYEPFTDALPSSSADEQFAITGRKNGFITPDNPNSSEQSPVGEPWVLLLFAAAAAVVIRLRRKNVKSTI